MNSKFLSSISVVLVILIGFSACKKDDEGNTDNNNNIDPTSINTYFIDNQSSFQLIFNAASTAINIDTGTTTEINATESEGSTAIAASIMFESLNNSQTGVYLYRENNGAEVEVLTLYPNNTLNWIEIAEEVVNNTYTFNHTLTVTDDMLAVIAETVTDADGNVYNTITLGNQTWMLENLKTTKFNDGTPITEYTFETHGSDWFNLNTPEMLYQWAGTADLNNLYDNELPFDFYGAMYNHLTIESGKLAPEGWRIPTEQDFIELRDFIANDGHAGNEATVLKSTNGWHSTSGNGTDLYGFTGLPNGYVNAFGGATGSETICTWATADIDETSSTRIVVNLFDQAEILFEYQAFALGNGIRCIKE